MLARCLASLLTFACLALKSSSACCCNSKYASEFCMDFLSPSASCRSTSDRCLSTWSWDSRWWTDSGSELEELVPAVVFELLATTAGTSSSNSLPESVRLLESQVQVERHWSDVLRQEAEGLRKSLQNSDAYFLVQQQALEDLSAKQEKVNKLAKHLASIMGTQDIVSWDLLKWFQFWTCFAAAFICCCVPYICTGGELWCPVDVICVIAVIA